MPPSIRSLLVALLAAVWAAAPGLAQTHVATVVSAAGTVEVQRSGSGGWLPAIVGTSLFLLDNVRTDRASTAKLLFVDDAVIDLAPASELSIDRYGAATGKGARRALLKLSGGKLEAIVSGYGDDSARFEIETPTAVARVQSTQFVVRFDSGAKATDVSALEGVVAVQGRTGLIGPGVAVGPGESTRVQQGAFPSPVRTMDAGERAATLDGLRIVGSGSREGLDVGNPVAEGRLVAAADRPELVAAGQAAAGTSYLRPGVPGETLIDRLSPDVRANTQPLPVYRAVPPNESPVPPH